MATTIEAVKDETKASANNRCSRFLNAGLLACFIVLLVLRAWLSVQLWYEQPASTGRDMATFHNQILSPTLDLDNWSTEKYGDGHLYLQRRHDDLIVHISGTGFFETKIYEYANLINGRSYVVSYRARADQPRTMKLRLAADNSFGPTTASRMVPINGHWRYFRYVFRADSLPAHHTRFPEFCFDNITGDIWLSDIRVTELN